MFERMTDQARRVIVLADGVARRRNHPQIETLDLLAGLIEQGGVAAKALADQDFTIESLRGGTASQEVVRVKHLGFSEKTKAVLDKSYRASVERGGYRDTRDLLIALLDVEESDVLELLTRSGVSDFRLRQTANKLAIEETEAKNPSPPEVVPGSELDADL